MVRPIAGFRFGALSTGMKPRGRADLALVVAETAVPAAALFTRNRVKGAPVVVSQERARHGSVRAIVVHSGVANACTGRAGVDAAQRVTRALARALDAEDKRVLIAGTGEIGTPLPVENIVEHMPDLVERAHPEGLDELAAAILTSDKTPKLVATELTLGRAKVRLVGCAKGSGLVAPNLATTLAFLFTDAAVDARWLRGMLREEVDATLNDVSVDGEASPNDSVFLLASGRADNAAFDGGPQARAFRAAVHDVLDELSQKILRDTDGVTRVVTIEVAGAVDAQKARTVARRLGASPLVRTALSSADPDWGRLLAVIGNAGIDVDPERIDVTIGDAPLVKGGFCAASDAEARARAVMKRDAYTIRVHLHQGRAEARHVTCDLTPEYLVRSAEGRS